MVLPFVVILFFAEKVRREAAEKAKASEKESSEADDDNKSADE